jgi:hypothetical protein
MTTLARLACLFALACGAAPPSESAHRFEPFVIPSPDGRVTVAFDTRTPPSAAGQFTYQVSCDGQRNGNDRAVAGRSHAGPARGVAARLLEQATARKPRQMERMKPQTTLEFDDAAEVMVRWR